MKQQFYERFDCVADSVGRVGDVWVVEGCQRRAEYACRKVGMPDVGAKDCQMVALDEPAAACGAVPGVSVTERDGQPAHVHAITSAHEPHLVLDADALEGAEVWITLTDRSDGRSEPCDVRLAIDGATLPVRSTSSSVRGGSVVRRFATDAEPLIGAARAVRVALRICARTLVLSEAERRILGTFAMRVRELTDARGPGSGAN